MLNLIHISDPHNESRTVERVVRLAKAHPKWDVIAMTGDCTSGYQMHVDERFNTLPQKHLFSVPGNHDIRDNAYLLLNRWVTECPWVAAVNGAWFLGLDSRKSVHKNAVVDILSRFRSNGHVLPSLFVIMMHHPPEKLGKIIPDILTSIFTVHRHHPRVLILNGHEHPKNFSRQWTKAKNIGCDWNVSISQICSSQGEHGGAHFITWDGQLFRKEYRYMDQKGCIITMKN